MHAREAAEAAARKKRAETPTVLTEAQQKAAEAEAAEREKEAEKDKAKPAQPKIRPLSESRAIELGANFLAESFIFGVAAGLLIWDQWRTRRKESTRREGIEERLDALEEAAKSVPGLHAEIQRLKSSYEPDDTNISDEESASNNEKEAARKQEKPEENKSEKGKPEENPPEKSKPGKEPEAKSKKAS